MRDYLESIAKPLAIVAIIFGVCVIIYAVVWWYHGRIPGVATHSEINLYFGFGAFGLGLISLGVALIAIGISSDAAKRQTNLLKRMDTSVKLWPALLKGDLLTPPGQVAAKEAMSEQSRIEAQERLDEDTRKVGFVRGELHQLEDGTRAIHWGGKYPL